MSSLLTEILISLVVIAVIGGIIGWMVRGVQVSHRENRLDLELLKAREKTEEAGERVRRLEESMKKMNQLRKTEREQLERRVRELEPLFDIVEKRDNRIRELTDELDSVQSRHQSELENLRFNLSTQALLEDDNAELEAVKQELQVANRQRESAINRYQSQLRQIEDLENVVKEKERLGEELKRRVESAEKSSQAEVLELKRKLSEQQGQLAGKVDELQKKIASYQGQVAEKEEELAMLANKKQYEQGLLENQATKAEEELRELRARLVEAESGREDALGRYNEASRQAAELRAELAEIKLEVAEQRREREFRPVARPAAIRAVPTPDPPQPAETPGPDSDLQNLKGIGRATANKLKRAGIQTLGQMAAVDEDAIERICGTMPDFRGKNERYEWVANARRLIGRDDNPGTANAKRG